MFVGGLAGLSNPLPLHPLIHNQGHAAVESHSGPGRDRCYLGDIQVEAVVQRDNLALHGGHELHPQRGGRLFYECYIEATNTPDRRTLFVILCSGCAVMTVTVLLPGYR